MIRMPDHVQSELGKHPSERYKGSREAMIPGAIDKTLAPDLSMLISSLIFCSVLALYMFVSSWSALRLDECLIASGRAKERLVRL